jgi:hypothetical protein
MIVRAKQNSTLQYSHLHCKSQNNTAIFTSTLQEPKQHCNIQNQHCKSQTNIEPCSKQYQTILVYLVFVKPISAAYSRKHLLQMSKPYFLIKPCLAKHTLLHYFHLPLTATFTVTSWVREPNIVVSHDKIVLFLSDWTTKP